MCTLLRLSTNTYFYVHTWNQNTCMCTLVTTAAGPSRPRRRRRGPGPGRPGLVGPPGFSLPVTQFSWARSLVLKYLGRPGRAGDSASAKSGQPGPGHHIFLLESAIFVLAGDAPAAVSSARGPGPGRLGRAASAAGWFRPGLVGPPGGELARSH